MALKNKFEVEANIRQEIGKGASRRLRRDDKVPSVVYGGGKAPASLTLEHKSIALLLENEAFYSHILTLKTGSDAERVILKDVQRHPFKRRILHLDFQRVRADEKLHMHVPLHFIGADMAPGVKDAGGIVSHIESDVEVSCFPDHLPESLEIDISHMEINQILHLSDIKLPQGVEIVSLLHGNDKAIVSVHMPRVEVEPEIETEAPVAPAEVPAMAQKNEADEAAAPAGGKESKKSETKKEGK
jgi:large subunit ribosomal protein L25